MAYRELGVIEIREVLRRFCLGESVRAIARATGSDWKTIAKHVAAARGAGLQRGATGLSDEHVAAALTTGCGTAGGRPGEIPERLTPHREQITAWLAEGLRLTKIHRRLREQGVGVPYSSLHRFAHASGVRPLRTNSTMRYRNSVGYSRWLFGIVHDAEEPSAVPAGVPAASHRIGAERAHARGAGAPV